MFTTIPVLVILISPLFAALLTIYNMFREKPVIEKMSYWISYIATAFLLLWISGEAEYTEALVSDGSGDPLHTPICGKYMYLIVLSYLLFFISHFIITHLKKRVPPLIMAVCSNFIFMGLLLNVTLILQLYKNRGNIFEGIPYFLLILINNILISVSAVEKIVFYCNEEIDIKYIQTKNKVILFFYSFASKSIRWYLFIFILSIPILLIFSIVLILCGHSPDEIIKAFTETGDWQFSKMESRFIIVESNGHYLCTVAANGHEKIVKPTRMGIRGNKKIVVNRQLCIANAFEQLIEEKFPKLHKIIRKNYDKYGYPLSKHINTKYMADLTYIVMKPLEWIFLICLYTFDVKAENRIAMQYTGKKIEEIIK